MRVVLATSNPGKAKEAGEILAGSPIEIVVVPLFIGEIEVGTTYLENARIKAANVFRLTHQAVLAEDAGIEVDALPVFPASMRRGSPVQALCRRRTTRSS